MYYLILENLKIYKYHFLLSIISVSFGIVLIQLLEFHSFFLRIMIMMIMLLPELRRMNLIANDGYFKLVNKLPLTSNEIYLYKFIVSTSGQLFILIMMAIATNFFSLPHNLFKFTNIMASNIYAGIIISNTTKLFGKSLIFPKLGLSFSNSIFYVFTLFIFFSLFSLITENNLHTRLFENRSLNYLMFYSLQFIIAFYIGKLKTFFSRFQFLKNYDYENEPKV